jgi:hypothetical protein
MTQTFTNSIWKREWIIDDEGIHEHRIGHRFATVSWNELKELGFSGARSEQGICISLRLARPDRRKFFKCASDIWKQQYPNRWKIHRDRAVQSANRAIYFWLPLTVLGPVIVCYVSFFYLGSPEYLRPQIQKLDRIAIIAIVYLCVMWIGYSYFSRRAKKREP